MRLLLVTLVSVVLTALSALATDSVDRSGWSAAADAAYDAIRGTHPEPFKRTPQARFEEELASLKARLPALSWPEYFVALRQFAALVQDGHTAFYEMPTSTPGFTTQFPLRFFDFADGLHVIRAGAGFEALLGGRVRELNGRPIAELQEAFATIVSGESPQWRANWVPVNLTYPGFHSGLGFVSPGQAEQLVVAVEHADGRRTEMTVPAVPVADNPALVSVLAARGGNAVLPLYVTEQRNISLHPRPEHRAVHVVFKSVANEPVKLAEFAAELERYLAEHDVDKLIFDVRNNGGGNNTLIQPLVHAVIRSPKVNRPGGVLVLTSRATFSAAQNFCSLLERETQALFVGEPTGLGPNHFGDSAPHPLGNTGLTLYVSTLRWQDGNPKDWRRHLAPDIPAGRTFADYLAGRDTVLETALAYRAPADAPVYPPIYRWRRDSQKEAVAAGRN